MHDVNANGYIDGGDLLASTGAGGWADGVNGNTQDLAGPPLFEEDYLILSTIHSAKGCEWDAVYVIHAADGNIPSDMATGTAAEIEEERRLFYVALTRAKDFLEVLFPLLVL